MTVSDGAGELGHLLLQGVGPDDPMGIGNGGSWGKVIEGSDRISGGGLTSDVAAEGGSGCVDRRSMSMTQT